MNKKQDLEVSKEIGATLLPNRSAIGNYTRDVVRIAEQQLAKQTGNDPSVDMDSKNK